jgi:hypothetical protein
LFRQKRRSVGRHPIPVSAFREEAQDRQVVAEDPQAALGSSTPLGDRRRSVRTLVDRGEDVEIDGSLQRRCFLVSERRVEEKFRRGRRSCRRTRASL